LSEVTPLRQHQLFFSLKDATVTCKRLKNHISASDMYVLPGEKKYYTISHGGANNHLNYGYHKLLYAMLDERDIVPQI
jgi:hypothetical protein